MSDMERLYSEIVVQKRGELARPLLRTADEAKWLEDTLMATVVGRQAGLSHADIVVYAKHLSGLDAEKYAKSDVAKALHGIATEPRGQYETAMPSVGEVMERVEEQRKQRTRETAQAAYDQRMAAQVAYAEKLRDERDRAFRERKAEAAAKQAAAAVMEQIEKNVAQQALPATTAQERQVA